MWVLTFRRQILADNLDPRRRDELALPENQSLGQHEVGDLATLVIAYHTLDGANLFVIDV